MNREGQIFYREGWHFVMLVVRSYVDDGKWMHEFISLTDLEELVGEDVTGKRYVWPEETAALVYPRSSWRQL